MFVNSLDTADMYRDQKKEAAMCAKGTCTSSHNLRAAPDGYVGPYGGSMVCQDCYEDLCEYIVRHGQLPNEG